MAWHIHTHNTKLQTGDIVETSASKWFLVHFGVIFFIDSVPYISHCPLKEGRPTIETLEEFESKRTIFRYFRNELTKSYSDEYILSRSEYLQRFSYDAATFNCEDYVKHIIEGVKLGLDLRLGIALTIITVIVAVYLIIRLARRR